MIVSFSDSAIRGFLGCVLRWPRRSWSRRARSFSPASRPFGWDSHCRRLGSCPRKCSLRRGGLPSLLPFNSGLPGPFRPNETLRALLKLASRSFPLCAIFPSEARASGLKAWHVKWGSSLNPGSLLCSRARQRSDLPGGPTARHQLRVRVLLSSVFPSSSAVRACPESVPSPFRPLCPLGLWCGMIL
jgi:hypothetical protein